MNSLIFLTYHSLDGDLQALEVKQTAFRNLVTAQCFTKLVSDIFTTRSLSQSKSLNAVIHLFAATDGVDMMTNYAQLYRVVVWENIVFKANAPPLLYDYSKTKKSAAAAATATSSSAIGVVSSSSAVAVAGGTTRESDVGTSSTDLNSIRFDSALSSSHIVDETKGSSSSSTGAAPRNDATKDEESAVIDPNDRKLRNTQMMKFLLSHISSHLFLTMQGNYSRGGLLDFSDAHHYSRSSLFEYHHWTANFGSSISQAGIFNY